MNFRSYEIKDICKIKSGKRLPKGTDFSEKPTKHKYIRARDIKNGKIDGSDLGYISEETQKKIERYIENDVNGFNLEEVLNPGELQLEDLCRELGLMEDD